LLLSSTFSGIAQSSIKVLDSIIALLFHLRYPDSNSDSNPTDERRKREEEQRRALRSERNVRELKDVEHGMDYNRLPNGVFGYLPGHLLPMPGRGGLSKDRGGTAEWEIFKDKDGDTFIVMFTTDADFSRLSSTFTSDPISFIATSESYNEFRNIIAVSASHIKSIDSRNFPRGPQLAEVSFQRN
jgi:hypothetical protein